MKVDSTNEALEAALSEYRKIYPEGAILQEIEEKASLNVITGENEELYTVLVCYWLKGQKEPFRFFEVEFDKRTRNTVVVRAEEPNQLNLSDLVDDENLGL